MNTSGFFMGVALATALLVAGLTAPARVDEDQFALAGAVPNDVFLYVAQRHNPERDFLDRYWGEVLDALAQSGIDDDLVELFGSFLYPKQVDEVERLKQRVSQLLAGVDWEDLAATELAFAERLAVPTQITLDRPPVLMADMVWLFRGSAAGAAGNYDGLVAILEAIVEEVNRALDAEALTVERAQQRGAQMASVDFLAMIPGAPPLPVSVALRDDVVVIALRERLFRDVLALMDGNSPKKALANDPRFKAAFAQLPPAEDGMVFFDMQALMKPLHALVETIVGVAGAPHDVYANTEMSTEVRRLNAQALVAYQHGDIEQALTLVEQAYDVAPENSIVLYNLGCFHALLGHREEALAWLEKSVEGGFYAPRKIVSDPDLESLREESRYKAALARAGELATQCCAEDTVINSSKRGEAHRLCTQAWQVYKDGDYEQGLQLVEQAYAAAPKDSRVLYYLACFHALLGHDDKALDFLDQAVEGGFYCPQHIAKDPDLESIRSHERYENALAKAKKKAAEFAGRQTADKVAVVRRLIDRLMNAVGILDYAATVETTDGYATWSESVTVLVPDAKERPIYPVFGKRPQLTDVDRFLPQETVSFSVFGGFNPGELHKFIEDSFRIAGPKGEELLAKWAELQKKFGVNVQKDIIDWIDGEFIGVTLADGGGSVWLIKVTDEQVARQKFSAAVQFFSTKLTEKLSEVAAENPALAALAMLGVHTSPVEHEQLEGFENLHFTMSPEPAVWGVADGYLILGTSADAVALCLATASGEHPSIRSNVRAMSEMILPDGPSVSVSLTDQRNLGEQYAKGIGIASMVTGMLGAFVPEPKVRPVITKVAAMLAKLTPVVRKIDFYKSTATHTTFDGQTWRTRTVTHYASPGERPAIPPSR